MPKSIFMGYTEVPAFRSIADVSHMLTQAGATTISQSMKDRKVAGITFTLPSGNGQGYAFELPVRVEPVLKSMLMQRHRPPTGSDLEALRKKAENVAWRQLSKWVEAQIAIVGIGMVQASEVFMPYLLGADGRTMYEHWQGRLLEAPKED